MSFDHGGMIYDAARQLACRPSEILDMSASINPLGLSSAVRAACLAALEQVHHYPDPVAHKLTQALANHYRVAPETVIAANGSTHLIHLLPAVFSGSRALIVAPAFSEYRHALVRHGWQASYHLLTAEDNFALDLERLLEQLTAERPQLLFLCNPANPSGTLHPPSLITKLVTACHTTGTLLVLDEAFMDFCGDKHSSVSTVVASNQGIVLRSLTKFYALAGLRLGCALASPQLAEQLRCALPPWDVNTVAQFAGVAALADHQYAAETCELIDDERHLMTGTLSRLPGITVFPSTVNYLLMRLSPPVTAHQLQERLLKKHRILLRDCSNFTGLDQQYVRMAIRSRSENERLLEALQEELHPAGEKERQHV